MDYFKLIRTWFDFAFENPEKIKPNHIALYTFCVEHCNRLGWKAKFGLPTEMAKDAIGIKSYHTYINTLNDLVDFGFIKMIERSKNQYSSNIIALIYFDKALDKALDKASKKHVSKHGQSIYESIDSIITHITKKQINKEQYKKLISICDNYFNKEIATRTYFEDSEINNLFIEHLKIRHRLKAQNTEIGIKALENKLRKLSDNNKDVAIQLIENAIVSNWKTYYPIKD